MNQAISEIKRVFTTRLDALEHILGIGDKHFAGDGSFMREKGVRFIFSAAVVLSRQR